MFISIFTMLSLVRLLLQVHYASIAMILCLSSHTCGVFARPFIERLYAKIRITQNFSSLLRFYMLVHLAYLFRFQFFFHLNERSFTNSENKVVELSSAQLSNSFLFAHTNVVFWLRWPIFPRSLPSIRKHTHTERERIKIEKIILLISIAML